MSSSLAEMATNKYVSFTTFTKAGKRKSTPVWIVDTGTIVGFTTPSASWKLKRLNADTRCELAPCDGRGNIEPGAQVLEATGRRATAAEYDAIRTAVRKKYRVMSRFLGAVGWVGAKAGRDEMADAAVVITEA